MNQGDEERELLKEENVVNATLTEYLEEAKLVRRSVIKVVKTIMEECRVDVGGGQGVPQNTKHLK